MGDLLVTFVVVLAAALAGAAAVLLAPPSLVKLPAVRRDRRPRVRMHLIDPPQGSLPSVEGLLTSHRHGEYAIALPRLIPTTDGNPVELESPLLLIPRDRVAFYEVMS